MSRCPIWRGYYHLIFQSVNVNVSVRRCIAFFACFPHHFCNCRFHVSYVFCTGNLQFIKRNSYVSRSHEPIHFPCERFFHLILISARFTYKSLNIKSILFYSFRLTCVCVRVRASVYLHFVCMCVSLYYYICLYSQFLRSHPHIFFSYFRKYLVSTMYTRLVRSLRVRLMH